MQHLWMTTKEDFGQRFREALNHRFPEWNDKGKKQDYAAKKLDMSQGHVSDYLTGKKMPGMDRACELAIELDVSLEWLMTGRGPKHPPRPQLNNALLQKVESLNASHQKIVERVVNSLLEEVDEAERARPASSGVEETREIPARP